MSKVKSPVLSLGARGSLGDSISYTRRRHVNILEKKPIPTDTRSLPQMYQRWLYQDYSALWHDLTAADKLFWRKAGSRLGITAFNAFMGNRLSTLPDIALWWRFDPFSPGIALDSGPNSLNGQILGATPVSGWIGGALSFDGIDDRVRVNNDPVLNPNSKTLEVLCYPTHAAGARIVAGNYNFAGGLNNKGFSLRISGPHFYAHCADGTGASREARLLNQPLNTLYHMALLHDYDNDLLYLYLNGLWAAQTACIGYTATTTRFLAGALDGLWRFDGPIDNVILYNRLLTPADILRHSLRRYPL